MFELHNKAHKNYYFLNPLLTQATIPVTFSLNFQPIKTPEKKKSPKRKIQRIKTKINLNIFHSLFSFLSGAKLLDAFDIQHVVKIVP